MVSGWYGYVGCNKKYMTLKGILFGACACGMLILATSASAPHKTASSGLNVGDVLPKMKSLDVGKHTLLSEDKTPKMTLIHFWAAYDAESRAENIQWSQYFEATPHEGIVYRGIALDPDRDVYMRTLALDQVAEQTQQCLDTEERTECMRIMGLSEHFHSYLINERGVICAVDPSPQEIAKYL